jgi:anti-sigma regulatory factor (Ser/Thr protein kinase)
VWIETSFPAVNESPAEARRWLTKELLQPLGVETTGRALAATSELVNNAVRHGDSGSEHQIGVRANVTQDTVRVEVAQSSSVRGARVVVPQDRPPTGGGLGLVIVEGLTERWGAQDEPSPHVWFEIGRRPAGA